MATYYDGFDWDIDGFPGEYVYGDYEYVEDYYMDERWKRIWSAPDYWVSTKARVWSSISESFIEGTPLRSGHIDISLRVNGDREHRYLHRLVAEAFIPNPYSYPYVRHLNDDPSDNEVNNLAWGTQRDNMRDCITNGHFRYFSREDVEKANEKRRTPVVAIRLRDGCTKYFSSQQEASRTLGINQSSINSVIRGRRRSACGYFFAKQEDFDDSFIHKDHSYQRRGMPIKATNLITGESRIYEKPRIAAFDLEMSEASVSNVLRGKTKHAKGWMFEELDLEDGDTNGRFY